MPEAEPAIAGGQNLDGEISQSLAGSSALGTLGTRKWGYQQVRAGNLALKTPSAPTSNPCPRCVDTVLFKGSSPARAEVVNKIGFHKSRFGLASN